MKQKFWPALGPSLLVGAGIIVSTFIAVQTAESWWVMIGPLVLAGTVVGADVMGSRLRGESSAPSWGALLLGVAFVLASVIVALRDPSLVKTFVAVIGPAAWVTVLLRPEGPRKTCRWI